MTRTAKTRMRAGAERTYEVLMTGFLALMLLSSITSASALETETISRRDLVIDLGDGLTKEAQSNVQRL